MSSALSSTVVSKASIAVNRFGYGARGNELEQAKVNPKQWVKSQLQAISYSADFPDSNTILLEHFNYQQNKKDNKNNKKQQVNRKPSIDKNNNNYTRKMMVTMSADTIEQAVTSSNSVSWRLLDFFSNHFSVSAGGRLMAGLVSTLEREAIAPNLLGNFADLLIAVEQHPAMLIYLNNERSFGPNSKIGKRRRKGLNENLAREILELHTLGVNGGYQQTDIVELAKAITGWSVINLKKEKGDGFKFRANGHESGDRKILGKNYSAKGVLQGEQMLRDLAVNPATAKYICYKLAHHFVSEKPAEALLIKMEQAWLKTSGNIKQVMMTLFDADEAWLDTTQKFKTPREFVISAHRVLSETKIHSKAVYNTLTTLGQKPFNSGSPAGYSDNQKDWAGASALMSRIDWTARVSSFRKNANAEKLIKKAFGQSISEHSYQVIMRAESRQQAFILFLMSPEFQRR